MKIINRLVTLPILLGFLVMGIQGYGQLGSEILNKAPDRVRGEGPWAQLIIRGAILIDGTLSPPLGPVDIVVEKNRISSIHLVGALGSSAYSGEPAILKPGGK